MYSLIQLTTNEWLKITKKKGFLISLIFIALAAIGAAVFINAVIGEGFISSGKYGSQMITMSSAGIIYLVLSIVTASAIVSQEFQLGTIKLLLIRAHQRTTILASKLIALIVYMVFMAIYFVVVAYIVGILFFNNTDGLMLKAAFENMAFTFFYTFVYATIAFMFSTILKSNGGTIAIVLALSIFEGLIVMLLSRYDFAKYILFFHTDFSQFTHEGSVTTGSITPTFSAIVYAVYIIVFLAITFTVFKKRDVA